jgi:hypothetical protein
MNRQTDGQTYRWTDREMDRKTERQTDRWTEGQRRDGQVNGQTERGMDRQKEEWTDRLVKTRDQLIRLTRSISVQFQDKLHGQLWTSFGLQVPDSSSDFHWTMGGLHFRDILF